MTLENFLTFPIIAKIISLIFLCRALIAGKRHWLLDKLPVSKTIGACVGLVKLEGTAETEAPVVSTLTQTRCVYYKWRIDEKWIRYVKETYEEDGRQKTRMVKKEGSDTVASGSDRNLFYLKDEYGVIQIRPNWAKFESRQFFYKSCGPNNPLYYRHATRQEVDGSTHERTFYEDGVALHCPVYIEGYARPRQDIAAAEVISPDDTELFLISTNSKEYHKGRYNSRFWWLSIWGLVFFAGIGNLNWDDFVYLLIWATGWAVLTYNNLISLCQSADQGLANVEVHIKRRHDLVGNLVRVVTALRDFEKEVQKEVTLLRRQLEITKLEGKQESVTACLPAVRAVIEKYPHLKTDAAFLDLQVRIADTEERIALTRTYYNEIATTYNQRLKMVPYRLIARLGNIRTRALIIASDFERATVPARFAE
jgi:hypothetical protein